MACWYVLTWSRNPDQDWAEGRYVFPLPERAAVDAFSFRIGERLVQGEIKPRPLAEELFREARQKGQRAAILNQHRTNLFSTAISNIDPGATVRVEISYLEIASYQNEVFSWRLPLTLTPRYMPGHILENPTGNLVIGGGGWAHPTNQVRDADVISPPQVHHVGQADNRAELMISVEPGVALREIKSRYHDLVVEQAGDVFRVFPREGTLPMNRDVSLEWQPVQEQAPGAALFRQKFEDRWYSLLMVVPPAQARELPTRELILVGDTSGSMAGVSMRKASELGRGSHVYIGDLSEVSEQMSGLFEKLERPATISIEIDWPEPVESYPKIIPDLYQGEPLMVVAAHDALILKLSVAGLLSTGPWSEDIEIRDASVTGEISRLWACEKIASLTDAMRRSENADGWQQQIVDTSLKFGVVSQFTSFLAVDKTPARSREAVLKAGRVPNLMPEGSAQQIPLPATDTGWRRNMMTALLALVLLIVLMLVPFKA